MSNTIKLSDEELSLQIASLNSDYNDMDTTDEDLSMDISDTMTLDEFTTCFQKMTDIMGSYKKLLYKDIKSLKEITDMYSDLDDKISQVFTTDFLTN